MAATNRSVQGPELPYWPYNCLSLYTNMARDFGRYAQAMTHSTDAMDAARAEGELGVNLFTDLMQGYYDLALAPWTAMAAMMTRQTQAGQMAAAPSTVKLSTPSSARPVKSRRPGH